PRLWLPHTQPSLYFLFTPAPPTTIPPFPYTTLFRSLGESPDHHAGRARGDGLLGLPGHQRDLLRRVRELLGAVQEVAVLRARADQHVHVEVWLGVPGGDQCRRARRALLDQRGGRGEPAPGEVDAQLDRKSVGQ